MCIIWLTLLCISCYFLQGKSAAPPNSVPMKIENKAGAPIDVFWIDTIKGDGSLVKQTTKPLRNNTDSSIHSYNTHEFVARFQKHIPGVEVYFTKGPSEERIVITYDKDANSMHARQITKFDEIMDQINEATISCGELDGSEFATCISDKISEDINRLTATTEEMTKYRNLMSSRLRDYVCTDPRINSTSPLKSESTVLNGRHYAEEVLLDTDRAKIWTIQNVISRDECAYLAKNSQNVSPSSYMEESAIISSETDTLGGANIMRNSNNVIWGSSGQQNYLLDEEFPDQDKLWPLYARVYSLVGRRTNYYGTSMKDILDAASVQLQQNSAPVSSAMRIDHYTTGNDGYSLRCDDHHITATSNPLDSSCINTTTTTTATELSSRHHTPGGRVGTAMLFCKTANDGGAIFFPHADVVIHPQEGSAIMITYKDTTTTSTGSSNTDNRSSSGSSSSIDDGGYTQHTGCAVRDGEQTIVTIQLHLA